MFLVEALSPPPPFHLSGRTNKNPGAGVKNLEKPFNPAPTIEVTPLGSSDVGDKGDPNIFHIINI